MVFRKVVEVINPQKPGDPFILWIQAYAGGRTSGDKYMLRLTKHQYEVFTMSELLTNIYIVPEDFLGNFVKAVRKVYEDEMTENMSRHVED